MDVILIIAIAILLISAALQELSVIIFGRAPVQYFNLGELCNPLEFYGESVAIKETLTYYKPTTNSEEYLVNKVLDFDPFQNITTNLSSIERKDDLRVIIPIIHENFAEDRGLEFTQIKNDEQLRYAYRVTPIAQYTVFWLDDIPYIEKDVSAHEVIRKITFKRNMLLAASAISFLTYSSLF